MTTPGPAGVRGNSGYQRLLASTTITNLGDGVAIIAYPWLASAVTRHPLLIALVAVAQRLPWLVFALPAGVITDRVDRRRLMVLMDVARAALTLLVAFTVLARQSDLPDPTQLDGSAFSSTSLYVILLLATLLMGCAEVLRDNAAQTFLPDIVEPKGLEQANGRMQSAELVANAFVGPPLGSFLLVAAFSLPFFVDAATFAVAAALVAAIPGDFSVHSSPEQRSPWTADLKEGFAWLWHHPLFRTLALALGALNMIGTMMWATLVLYAQEVLGTSATEFALLGTGAAFGGIIGGVVVSRVTAAIGPGPSLWVTLVGGGLTSIVAGLSSSWQVVWAMTAISALTGILWNVITVSLRQAAIPKHLLGRVNSVYRFFGWGSMPLGALLGGLTISITETMGSREFALRMPWLIAGVAHLVLFALVASRLTTSKIEAIKATATS